MDKNFILEYKNLLTDKDCFDLIKKYKKLTP